MGARSPSWGRTGDLQWLSGLGALEFGPVSEPGPQPGRAALHLLPAGPGGGDGDGAGRLRGSAAPGLPEELCGICSQAAALRDHTAHPLQCLFCKCYYLCSMATQPRPGEAFELCHVRGARGGGPPGRPALPESGDCTTASPTFPSFQNGLSGSQIAGSGGS